MFVDRVEQKVTTNPKLGQNHKVGQLKKQIYNYVLIVFIVTLWTGGGCMKWWYMCFNGTLQTINSEVAIQCSDRTE